MSTHAGRQSGATFLNMNILALESSGASVGIAAWSDEAADETTARPLAAWSSSEPRALSREIMRGIDETLQGANWNLDDVDALALGLGPGSWTSLRIGLSTGKTLAQARGWRLAGIPTFDAWAQTVWRRLCADEITDDERAHEDAATSANKHDLPPRFLLLTTAHCRAGEVYGRIFECRRESLTNAQAEWADTPQAMCVALESEAKTQKIDAPFVLIGEGAPEVASVLEKRGQAHHLLHLSITSLAAQMAQCAQTLLEAGHDSNPLRLQPLYIAPSAAERNFRPKPGRF